MNNLPESGFLRLPQIIGQREVTEEQAKKNKKSGKGPKTKRPAIPAIIPVSNSTWWDGVNSGRYPAGVKLSPHCTAWRIEDIRTLIKTIKYGGE